MLPKPQNGPQKRKTDYLWHIERIRLESARRDKEWLNVIQRDLLRQAIDSQAMWSYPPSPPKAELN